MNARDLNLPSEFSRFNMDSGFRTLVKGDRVRLVHGDDIVTLTVRSTYVSSDGVFSVYGDGNANFSEEFYALDAILAKVM